MTTTHDEKTIRLAMIAAGYGDGFALNLPAERLPDYRENPDVRMLLSFLDTMNPARPTAIYLPPIAETDDQDGQPAMLRCPVCAGTDMYEVDRAVRWTEVKYGAHKNPARVTVFYGDDGDYESDHLLCATDGCSAELDYPDNWQNILHES